MTSDQEPILSRQFHSGQTVPLSGIYRISHGSQHPDMSADVLLVKGGRFPACLHCRRISFELFCAARHVEEIEHLQEEEFVPAGLQGLSTEA